ncbi:MAG: hypothetical protein ACQKBU_10495, partial [Verrucomicrobiales bacterium]
SLLSVFALTAVPVTGVSEVATSLSLDGKFHPAMNMDRDPGIAPEWKEDSFSKIEVTEKASGPLWAYVDDFRLPGSDTWTLRENVRLIEPVDSTAFATTIDDRFYSPSVAFLLTKDSKFVEIACPSYEVITGFPSPERKYRCSRGRATIEGWDQGGQLIYDLIASPVRALAYEDPPVDWICLDVSADEMTPRVVESDESRLSRATWILTKVQQGVAPPSARCPELDSKGSGQPNLESEARTR